MESLYFWSWKLEQKKEKKAWINCELRLSDQEKACKSESGGLELSQQRDHSWAQRKNKDLRKTAMPRLRGVDLKLQGCAQPACISFILSWWAISRGSFSFAMAVKSLCSSLFQAPVLAACAAKAWCACQFSFVWWHFHVWRWKKKRKAVSNEPTYRWSPWYQQPVWHVYMEQRPPTASSRPDECRVESGKASGIEMRKLNMQIVSWLLWCEDEEQRWTGGWIDGW